MSQQRGLTGAMSAVYGFIPAVLGGAMTRLYEEEG
jgi:hypothetical protein